MALPPIDFGPPVQADNSGIAVAKEAVAQRQRVFGAAGQVGENVQTGGLVIAQGLLHNQVLKATADTKETQAKVLKFIDDNKYITKAQMADMMKPEDLDAWANKNPAFAGKESVPMYSVAGELYDSVMHKTLDSVGQSISLPGWRQEWNSTSRTEIATIRERYVNRIAADQMIADNRAVAHDSIVRMIDGARTKEDLDAAKAGAMGVPWFQPGEREILGRMADARKDTLDADNALAANQGLGDLPAMRKELDRIAGPDAPKNFPNISEQQRLTLQRRLETQIKAATAQSNVDEGLQWARDMSAKHVLPGSTIVDRGAMLEEFKGLKGDPAKIKTAEAEMNRLAEEGQRAQEDKDGRAFNLGVVNIDKTGDMGASVRAALSNPNASRAAGGYYERLLTIQKMREKDDPIQKLEYQRAWVTSRTILEGSRATGTSFDQFLSTPVDQEGGTIGSTLDPKKLAALQNLFIAKQQTEKRNDAQPLSGENLRAIRLVMRDAYGIDPGKTLTPEQLAIHASIEQHVLNERNMLQDGGGQVKAADYAKWISEAVDKSKNPLETHWYKRTLTPAELTPGNRPTPEERPDLYRTKDGQTRFWNGIEWVE